MHVVIFEGSRLDALAPLSLSRPTFTLGAGTGTLLDKQIRFLKPSRLTLWIRPAFEEWCRAYLVPRLGIPTEINTPLDDQLALLTTGRTLYLTGHEQSPTECVVVEAGNLIRKAMVKRPGLSPHDVWNRTDKWLALLDLPRTMPQARFIDHPWDLVSWNEEALIVDSIAFRDQARPAPEDGPYYLINREDVLIQDGAKLLPSCPLAVQAQRDDDRRQGDRGPGAQVDPGADDDDRHADHVHRALLPVPVRAGAVLDGQ